MYDLRKKIRNGYDKAQAEKDIQLQLSGGMFEEKIKTDLRRSSQHTEKHMKLIEAMLSLPGSSRPEENERRSKAIRAIIDYCGVEEGGTPRNHRVGPCANYGLREAVKDDEETLEEAKIEVFTEKRPRRCFICLGNKALPVKERAREFSAPGTLNRHFKDHLRRFNNKTGERCNLCKLHLKNEEHMKRHAFDKHGTVVRI
jgi:hypothetical protein